MDEIKPQEFKIDIISMSFLFLNKETNNSISFNFSGKNFRDIKNQVGNKINKTDEEITNVKSNIYILEKCKILLNNHQEIDNKMNIERKRLSNFSDERKYLTEIFCNL